MKAEKIFNSAKEIAVMLGIESERVRLEWISSAEGTKFAEIAQEFTEQIQSLGPLQIEETA